VDGGIRGEGTQQGSILGGSGRPVVEPSTEETSTSGQGSPHTHFLCVSPDAPTNPVLYWLGNFDSGSTRFLLEGAKGPLRLDLGDILYAPNLMVDDQVSRFSSALLPEPAFLHSPSLAKVNKDCQQNPPTPHPTAPHWLNFRRCLSKSLLILQNNVWKSSISFHRHI